MHVTSEKIEELLGTYLNKEEAAKRAVWLSEDLNKINFELIISDQNPQAFFTELGALPQAEYKLPKTGFDINSPDDNSCMEGSFITLGNLLRLSQCSKYGRRYIPHLWPHTFQVQLLNSEHLSTLNEVWWLKFWRGIESVNRGPKKNRDSPDYEWQMRLRDGLAQCQINLEVKRRPGNINQHFKHGRPKANLNDIAKKFVPVSDDTANVAAVTVFMPIVEEARRSILEWLERQPHVHGILIWTEGNLGAEALFKCFKPEKKWAEFLVGEPEAEDLCVAGRSWGTLCKASEAPAFIQRMAEKVNSPTIYL